MSARDSRFGASSPRSTKNKAAGAVIACAVMLLAGCGGSAADAGAPVIRGDAATSSVTTVTFKAGGGNGVMANQSASTATALSSNTFTNGVFVFDGWSMTDHGLGTRAYADQETYPFTASVTLYAMWRDGANVVFDPNLGSGTMAVQYGTGATALSPNTFIRIGYAFNGWSASSKISGRPYADGATYPFQTSTTLYAQWVAAAPVYTVTFNANDGSGSITSQSASTATALTLNAGAITRSGYTFGGWNTSANGNGTAYADGTSYQFAASSTLYATWVAVPSTVTFDANDGSGSIPNQSASTATPLTLNANALNTTAFTRSGYAFGGWATTRTGSMAYADGASYPFTETAILYATWGCLPLTVTASAKRVGANKAEVYFTAPSSESPWKSFAANAAKEGGKGATRTTALNTGTITVTSLDKNSGYTFDVTATNEAGCTYKATANRVMKW